MSYGISNKSKKVLIVIGLLAAVTFTVILKQNRSLTKTDETAISGSPDVQSVSAELQNQSEDVVSGTGLPRLVDLGAHKCIPCKMMAPILEELKKEYSGSFEVEFLDVWKDPDIARRYKIRIIPTQIFYDRSGKELFRHQGFFSKKDILAKWKELGVELTRTK